MLNFERSRNLVSVNRQKTVILKVGLNKYVFNVVHLVGTLNVMCWTIKRAKWNILSPHNSIYFRKQTRQCSAT